MVFFNFSANPLTYNLLMFFSLGEPIRILNETVSSILFTQNSFFYLSQLWSAGVFGLLGALSFPIMNNCQTP